MPRLSPLNRSDMDAISALIKAQREFVPVPAVKALSKTRFQPEISFQGKQYILTEPMLTHQEAMKLADQTARIIVTGMIRQGLDMLSGFKIATE